MTKGVRSLIGWVLYIGFLVGLIYGIPKGLSYVLKTPYPMASITSGSMWPVLKKGDLVFIEGIKDRNQIHIGDIVVYRNPQGFTIHRVIALTWDSVITKGDANNVSDPPVSYSDVIGKALSINGKPVRVPLLGNVSILINNNKVNGQSH